MRALHGPAPSMASGTKPVVCFCLTIHDPLCNMLVSAPAFSVGASCAPHLQQTTCLSSLKQTRFLTVLQHSCCHVTLPRTGPALAAGGTTLTCGRRGSWRCSVCPACATLAFSPSQISGGPPLPLVQLAACVVAVCLALVLLHQAVDDAGHP